MSFHEKNIIEVANLVLEKAPHIKYDCIYKDGDISTHVAKKLFVDGVKKYFITYLQRYVENPDHLISIRWFYTQKLIDFINIDPLLPYNTDDNEGLYYELEKINVPEEEIRLLQTQVSNMIKSFEPKIQDTTLRSSYADGIVTLTYGPLSFQLHEQSYNKLVGLHREDESKKDKNIFILLCRYEALASPGYHASIPEKMSRLIRDELSVSMQLFASPFNCDPEINYCSAYPDTDTKFGSQGNFFSEYSRLFENGGSFEANPPFLEEHMAALSILIEKTLKSDNPFSFVVVYPTWEDAISFRMLQNSKYNVLNTMLNFESGDHSYLQSSQYWVRNFSRKSNSRSTIFILQNESGKLRYPVRAKFIEELKKCFKSN